MDEPTHEQQTTELCLEVGFDWEKKNYFLLIGELFVVACISPLLPFERKRLNSHKSGLTLGFCALMIRFICNFLFVVNWPLRM